MDYREPIAGCRAGEGSRMDHVNVPHAVRPSADQVVAVTDEVCRAHLDMEYADLCRAVVGKLGRKRPSPLTRGDPEVVKLDEASGSDCQAAGPSFRGSLIQADAGSSRIFGSWVVANLVGCCCRAASRGWERCWAVSPARP